jgi:hypothetical protein
MRLLCLIVLGLVLPGCAPRTPTPPPLATARPIGLDVIREVPELKLQRFNTLMDFEADVDAVFVSAPGGGAQFDGSGAHTGSRSLRIDQASPTIEVKLSSLVMGRPFPGTWTLVGAYVRRDAPAEVALTLTRDGEPVGGGVVRLSPGKWTAVMVDLSPLQGEPSTATTAPEAGDVRLSLTWRGEGFAPLFLDDVMLVDNAQTLVDGSARGTMSVRKKGLKIHVDHPARFAIALDALEGKPDGWVVEEAGPMRARFTGGADAGRALAVYASGASYWNGEFKPLHQMLEGRGEWARSHASPAQVKVPESQGRVLRTTPGDANNDGYNEQRGAYQLEASGGRLEFTVRPATPLVLPVFEIAGLPAGKVLVTVEGRLVDSHDRLPDGRVLIELPMRVQRDVTVSVRGQ